MTTPARSEYALRRAASPAEVRSSTGCHTEAPGGSSIAPIVSISTRVPAVPFGVARMRLIREIGQEFVQPGPGEAAIHGAPHAEIVGHHDLIRIHRRYRHAVLSEADHRFRLEGGQVGPGAAAVFGAEELPAQPVDPAEARGHGTHSVFRDADHGWGRLGPLVPVRSGWAATLRNRKSRKSCRCACARRACRRCRKTRPFRRVRWPARPAADRRRNCPLSASWYSAPGPNPPAPAIKPFRRRSA